MMPPTSDQISDSDLWTQITAMPRPHRLVDFPRTLPDGTVPKVAFQVLSQDEGMAAKASAEGKVRKILKDSGPASGQGYADLSEMRESMELLFRACRQPDNMAKPFFPTVEAVGKLTTDEIAVMVLNYRRVQMELGPIASEMSNDEVDAWVERLAKGGSLFPFDGLSSGAQSRLITSMASRLWSFMTDRSSPGSQPDEPT